MRRRRVLRSRLLPARYDCNFFVRVCFCASRCDYANVSLESRICDAIRFCWILFSRHLFVVVVVVVAVVVVATEEEKRALSVAAIITVSLSLGGSASAHLPAHLWIISFSGG